MQEFTLCTNCLEDRTFGFLQDKLGQILAVSIERPWANNESNVSCIPHGTYKVQKDDTGKFRYYKLTHKRNEYTNEWIDLRKAIGRDAIEIHHGNYSHNFQGCIGLGEAIMNINNGSFQDWGISNTKNTINKLKSTFGKEFVLHIKRSYTAKYKNEEEDYCYLQ